MEAFLFSLLLALTGAFVARAVWRPSAFYEYPTLAALVYLGWALPQAYALLHAPDLLPEGGLRLTLLMMLACFIGVAAGWYAGGNSAHQAMPSGLDLSKLLVGVLVLSLFGSIFSVWYHYLPIEMQSQRQKTGIITIIIFFMRTQVLAFALAILIFLRNRSRIALTLAIFNFAFFSDRIFFLMKRETAVETIVIVLAGLWFVRGWMPPRGLLLMGAILGSLVVNSIGNLRQNTVDWTDEGRVVRNESWLEGVAGIDFVGNLLSVEKDPSRLELANSTYTIASHQYKRLFSFGSTYWDEMVHGFFPGQIFGEEVKSSLMLNGEYLGYQLYNHTPYTGTTSTGFADTFQNFWFFGAGVFFLISLLLRNMFERARSGSLLCQYGYLVLIGSGMTAITHSSGRFLVELVIVAVFTASIFALAYSAPVRSSRFEASKRPPRPAAGGRGPRLANLRRAG